MPRLRFHVNSRAVPTLAVARRLGVSEAQLNAALPELIAKHGFPKPLPLVGTFDLAALDCWMDRQNPALSSPSGDATAVDARRIDLDARLARMALLKEKIDD